MKACCVPHTIRHGPADDAAIGAAIGGVGGCGGAPAGAVAAWQPAAMTLAQKMPEDCARAVTVDPQALTLQPETCRLVK